MGENIGVRFIHRIATGKPIYRKLMTPVGPLVFFGLVALFVLAARRTDQWLGLGMSGLEPWNTRLSRPFMLGGLFFTIWSASYFIRARGTPVPFNPPPKLVISGPFAWTRNPMMTGLFSVLFGLALRLGSWSLLGFYLPFFVALICLELKMVEEPGLEKRFGEVYRDYRSRTPMFFPWQKP
ncbi:MAG: isoprenylcysteine carboxylmethyltransferase family protein [Proteobacteria bacterium]|nr:isoprenylcysteine carboxylmethyltransferase family protein [Pseudomonadota bacterium]MBU1686130.1 isoprenylcysteine carboxylmethyltransferase family protein [Pseudomonadota bacterium]